MLDLAVEYIKDLQEQVQVQENYIPCPKNEKNKHIE